MKYLFFDLDGTLIDIHRRQYGLYEDFARQHGYQTLSLGAYQHLRRQGTRENDVAGMTFPDNSIADYSTWREKHIEDEKYLKKNFLYRGAKPMLSSLQREHLTIITSRHDKESVTHELARLGIAQFFSQTCAVGTTDAVRKKANAIYDIMKKERVAAVDALLVGDTEIEYDVARNLAIGFIAVSYGVRTKEFLTHLGARVVVDSVPALRHVLIQWCS